MWWRARPGCDVGPFNLIGPTPEKPPASKGFALAAAQEYKKPVSSIIDLLVKIQLIDERQHEAVMSRSASRSGGHIVQQVAELGYATEGTIARAISVELGLPRIDLSMTPPEGAALGLLDARTCADRFLLPVALRENGELLWLAMADPADQEAIELVRRKAQKRVRPAVAGPTE